MPGLGPIAEGLRLVLGSHSTVSVHRKETILHARNYEVMDANRQRLLCLVKEATIRFDPKMYAGMGLPSAGTEAAKLTKTGGFLVEDSAGNTALMVLKFRRQERDGHTYHVVDPEAHAFVGFIHAKAPPRKPVTEAVWATVDGRVLMSTSGKRPGEGGYAYVLSDPDGRELSIVRHRALAFRDIWDIEMKPGSEHLASMILATVWECERLPRGAL